ncbi:hypothetical protein BDZ89DRAFT_1114384 [Hymenopellis radicata]|nr:hypothetical protein BDZ89DRAFT_1114384 [Hymenopellis radicata]
MNNPLLLPELVELIVEHSAGDEWVLNSALVHGSGYGWLQNCALISRAWAAPCQRALFRHISLHDSDWVVRLLHHLRRYSHLQNLIQWMVLWQTPIHGEARDDYLSCLIALFPLIPRLTCLHVRFDRPGDAGDRQFIEALGAFLHTSESLTNLVVNNRRDETDFHQIFSCLEGTNIKRVSLYAEPYLGDDPSPVGSTLSVVHLPAIEQLRFNLTDVLRLHPALNFWLRQMFPNLKHLEVVVNRPSDVGLLFRDVLQLQLALRLESFRLELMPRILDDLPIYEGLFEGLHFNHFKLCLSESGPGRSRAQTLINWLSSMFLHLADSRTTVHFVELTFTFVELDDVEAVSAEWATLDEVLSHAAFDGVQRIHFEEDSDEKALITDRAHPEPASVIRRALPRLASRGVLCFE